MCMRACGSALHFVMRSLIDYEFETIVLFVWIRMAFFHVKSNRSESKRFQMANYWCFFVSMTRVTKHNDALNLSKEFHSVFCFIACLLAFELGGSASACTYIIMTRTERRRGKRKPIWWNIQRNGSFQKIVIFPVLYHLVN